MKIIGLTVLNHNMSSKKKRQQIRLKAVPTLDLSFKSFKMVSGKFAGGNIKLCRRNPHGRWSIQFLKSYGRGPGIGNFTHLYEYIDEVDFFKCVEQTPEIKQFTRDLALKKLLC